MGMLSMEKSDWQLSAVNFRSLSSSHETILDGSLHWLEVEATPLPFLPSMILFSVIGIQRGMIVGRFFMRRNTEYSSPDMKSRCCSFTTRRYATNK